MRTRGGDIAPRVGDLLPDLWFVGGGDFERALSGLLEDQASAVAKHGGAGEGRRRATGRTARGPRVSECQVVVEYGACIVAPSRDWAPC
jgi:hypothetical protein